MMIAFDEADLFDWLPAQAGFGAVVTMLPDAAELGVDAMVYKAWLRHAANVCLATADGPVVFAQTDRLRDGAWFDKASLIANRATFVEREMLWHKIVLRRGVGATDLHRPTYTHLLAFGPGRPGRRTPDVIDGGPRRWANGVGIAAARFVADWFVDVGVERVLNPAAGYGTFATELSLAGITVRACDVVRRGAFETGGG